MNSADMYGGSGDWCQSVRRWKQVMKGLDMEHYHNWGWLYEQLKQRTLWQPTCA